MAPMVTNSVAEGVEKFELAQLPDQRDSLLVSAMERMARLAELWPVITRLSPLPPVSLRTVKRVIGCGILTVLDSK